MLRTAADLADTAAQRPPARKPPHLIPMRARTQCTIVALATGLAPFISAHADNAEVWADTRFATRWSDHVTFFGAAGFRWDEGQSSLARLSLQGGFDIRVSQYVTLSPTYQRITNEPEENTRADEQRFGLAISTARKIEEWQFRANLRVEYRDRGDQGTSWWLRPSIGVQRPLGPENWRLSAFSTIEGFILPEDGEWTRTRMFFGLRKGIFRDCDLELFYARQWNHDDSADENIFGIALRFLFDRRDRPRRLQRVEGLLDTPN